MKKFPPERIVCLTEETVETIYLLGEEKRIVGVTGYATRPKQVRNEKPRISSFISANVDKIIDLKPDLVVVVAFGQIIPNSYLQIPNLIFLNVHASLLPKWRGAAPIQRSIMNLDQETGISIMKINEKLDRGPV